MDGADDIAGIDPAVVVRWLVDLGVEHAAPLRCRRIGLGQSNLTYRITDAVGRAWVLRRPPRGRPGASAHGVVGEARIISALTDTGVAVPRIIGVTTRHGEPLVLMEFVEGLVVDRMNAAEALTHRQRHGIALSMPRTLAKIAAVDLTRVGLQNLASKQPYVHHQLAWWSAQWERSKRREVPLLDALTRRLVAAAPEQHEAGLVHGDFHFPNVIFSRTTGEVAAVVDWELSDGGDPVADMGALLTYWPEPGETMGGDFEPSTLAGFPTRAEIARVYLDETGRDPAVLQYWHAFGLWKLAIIGEGVLGGAINDPWNMAGQATRTFDPIDVLVEKAWSIADSIGVDTYADC
ncbi:MULTISPECIES: phosphotransferase family protein [Nocardia]|uniref:phosphotransferase family protein n=1 Tax=Nocardia TaxID=1817 RepID=UPI0002EBD341|nr:MULTISPECIES: phosphotransferase family protein [Nocardia]